MATQNDNTIDQAADVSLETAYDELTTLLLDLRHTARLLCSAATSEELELGADSIVQTGDRIERDVDRCAELAGQLARTGTTPHDAAKQDAVDEGAVNGSGRSVSPETASELNQQALGLLFEIAAVGDLLSLAAGTEKGDVEIPSGTLLEAGSMIQEKAQQVVELVEELTPARSWRPVIEPASFAPGERPAAVKEAVDANRFAIPDVIGKHRADSDEWSHDASMAALKHAKHLRKAEGRLAKATGLAETLRCALRSDDYDPEAVADEVVASIVDLLDQAQAKIDRHRRVHSNLFLAYFDRQRPAGGEGGAS
jgi:hypothetical protein